MITFREYFFFMTAELAATIFGAYEITVLRYTSLSAKHTEETTTLGESCAVLVGLKLDTFRLDICYSTARSSQ